MGITLPPAELPDVEGESGSISTDDDEDGADDESSSSDGDTDEQEKGAAAAAGESPRGDGAAAALNSVSEDGRYSSFFQAGITKPAGSGGF